MLEYLLDSVPFKSLLASLMWSLKRVRITLFSDAIFSKSSKTGLSLMATGTTFTLRLLKFSAKCHNFPFCGPYDPVEPLVRRISTCNNTDTALIVNCVGGEVKREDSVSNKLIKVKIYHRWNRGGSRIFLKKGCTTKTWLQLRLKFLFLCLFVCLFVF